MDFQEVSSDSIAKLVKDLQTDERLGLTQQIAFDRLQQYGPNKISHKEQAWYHILWRQIFSPFIIFLLFAALLSYVLNDSLQASIIVIMVAINVFVGFYQENTSNQLTQYLRSLILAQAQVIRDGKEKTVAREELVPGDLIVVRLGDVISADVRFVAVENCTVDQAILTGESEPVVKNNLRLEKKNGSLIDYSNIGFAGTTVITGRALAIVFATGENSEFGKVAALSLRVASTGFFEKTILKFTWFMIAFIMGLLLLVIFLKMNFQAQREDIYTILMFALAVAISITPESLPVVIAISLAQGARSLARNGVVVKKLSALNDLGSIQVLCADKTGTLTENKPEVVTVYGSDQQKVLEYAVVGSGYVTQESLRTPLDKAFWIALNKLDNADSACAPYKVFKEIPFDASKRRSGVIVKVKDQYILIVRGAAEVLLRDSINFDTQGLQEWVSEQHRQARRVFVIAAKEFTQDEAVKFSEFHEELEPLTLVGCIALEDEVKKDVQPILQRAQELGIVVKIITGDAQDIAGAVAYQVGLIDSPEKVLLGDDFEKLEVSARRDALAHYSVFARVSPIQKYEMIRELEKYQAVGFLGDGINDAPALKLAHVGLVVQGAADIAREAADVVLMRKNLKSIIDGIEVGRRSFANANKYVITSLSSTVGNSITLVLVSLLFSLLPMWPIQILLLNFLADMPMMLIAIDSVDQEILARPVSFNFTKTAYFVVIAGSLSVITDMIFFTSFHHYNVEYLRTGWFLLSVMTANAFIFLARTEKPFWKAQRPPLPLVLISSAVIIGSIVLTFTPIGARFFRFVTLDSTMIIILAILTGLFIVILETSKLLLVKFLRKTYPEQKNYKKNGSSKL